MTDFFYPLTIPPPPPAPPGSDDPKYPLVCKTDYITAGAARLIKQFEDKPRIQAVLASYNAEIQELEDALWELTQAYDLDTAVGVFLDDLGNLAVIKRNGLSDSDYRVRISAKHLANLSLGRTQDLVAIIRLLLGGLFPITIEEPGRLTTCLSLDDPLTTVPAEDINFLMQLAKQAGSRLFLKYQLSPDTDTFTYDDALAPGSDPDLGFDDANAPGSGGHYRGVLTG